ncbi:OsmC family protein [bacterium]|nr:OsmC family protein [bacterium]
MANDTLNVELLRVDGLSLAARTGSGHWLSMDTSSAGGGHGGAASPVELVLAALAGCMAMDILSMLAKMRARIEDFRIEARAERAPEPPRVFTKVDLTIRVRGDVKPRQIEKAIALSHERYCSVGAMLKPSVPIAHHYVLEPSTALADAESPNPPEGASRSDA